MIRVLRRLFRFGILTQSLGGEITVEWFVLHLHACAAHKGGFSSMQGTKIAKILLTNVFDKLQSILE